MNHDYEAVRQALQKAIPHQGVHEIAIQDGAELNEDTALKLISSGKPFLLTDAHDTAKSAL